MNNSMINASVSMNALQQKLDVLANNMANLNTVGFKRKEATFEDILTNMKEQPQGFQRAGRLSPLGLNQGWGAKLSTLQLNLSQGTLNSTANPTDLAIEGGALFEVGVKVADENGAITQRTAYTRDGSFSLSVQPNDPNFVYLTTKEGHYVKGIDDQPIKIPKGYKFAVREDGVVSAYQGSQPELGSTNIGQLKLVRVIRPQYLQEVGNNLYALQNGVDNTKGQIIKTANLGSNLEEKVAVRQGFLEQSNVNLSDEMTELMTVQRAFQLSSRALVSADNMMNLANNLRG